MAHFKKNPQLEKIHDFIRINPNYPDFNGFKKNEFFNNPGQKEGRKDGWTERQRNIEMCKSHLKTVQHFNEYQLQYILYMTLATQSSVNDRPQRRNGLFMPIYLFLGLCYGPTNGWTDRMTHL